MNTEKAVKILNLPLKHISLSYEQIRKAYLKASLKYHPDKSKDNGDKFKEISEAYRYLIEENKFDSMKDTKNIDIEETYETILEEFICKFYPNYPDNLWSKLFIKTTLKTIIHKCENASFKVFETLDKNKCGQIYDLMININDSGIISQEYIDKMQNIVKEKYKNDNIILLEPSLEDLLNDKIFKLDISDNTYYVPLWHNEVFYDFKIDDETYDLVVKIEPDIPDNIFIDHDNNLFIKERISLLDVYNNKGYKYILPNNQEIFIEADKINLSQKTQMFKYEHIGILNINEDNMFQADKRGSIIFELILENKKYNM